MKTFFKGFKEGFQDFGHNISGLVNTLLLTVVYVFGVGITSVFARVFGKKFLVTEVADGDTYWEDMNLHNKTLEESYKQF